jgi:hypothetical protein
MAVPTLPVRLQLCPPKVIAKVAVPLLAGVPVIVYVTLLLPLARVPAPKVAVSPVTPVEETLCALYVPELPPVYGTLTLTLLAAWPLVSVPMVEALPQLRVVREAGVVGVPQDSFQPFPTKKFKQLVVVLKITKPMAGEAIPLRWTVVIRGGKKPWVVEVKSVKAEA